MWNKTLLKNIVNEKLKDHLFVIVSNREPYIHVKKNGNIKEVRAISGVTAPLDSIMQTVNGLWVAYGSGDADKQVVNKRDIVKLPLSNPKYKLKRVWLNEKEVQGYYLGYSNETLWPLCHVVYIRPSFDEKDWQCYKKVNEKFAEKILEEVGNRKAFIWIQDYHFTLLPKLLKKKNPNLIIAQFWHIPWPVRQIFKTCPQKKEILEGMLENELLGFHLESYCRNFLSNVAVELEAKVDYENRRVIYKGHETIVRAFPISVDYDRITKILKKDKLNKREIKKFIDGTDYKHLCVSVDRIEYTKGILERIKSVDRFLEKYPKYRGSFVYLGIGVKSRSEIKEYQELIDNIDKEVQRINDKYKTKKWQPIFFKEGMLSADEILNFYRNADICMVNSLDDGMNLVCKEFVASAKEDSVLILSQFTGASRELTESLLINPYDIEKIADTIKQALEMSKKEKISRMKNLKLTVRDRNIYRWAGKFITELSSIWEKKNL